MSEFDFVKQSTQIGRELTVHGSFLYVAGESTNVHRSTDGINWTDIGQFGQTAIDTFDGFVYIALGTSIKRASATSWSADIFPKIHICKGFEVFGSNLYVFGSNQDVNTRRDNIGRTSDGTSWSGVTSNGLNNFGDSVYDLQEFNGALYASLTVGFDAKVYRSPDGTTWTKILDVTGKHGPMAVLGDTLYLFPTLSQNTIYTTTTGDLGDWTENSVSDFHTRHKVATIDNRIWGGGYTPSDQHGFIGSGVITEDVTFDIAPSPIFDYVDFLGFVWAVTQTGSIYKGPASSGYVFTPAPEEFRLPVLQDFDWQPPVTAIQDTPPV